MVDAMLIVLILAGIVLALAFSAMAVAMAAMMLDEIGFTDWVRERIEERRNDESWLSDDKDR